MNKANSDKLNLTKAQIEKASNICSQVRELLQKNKPEEDLTKADPSDGFFSDPQEALMSEEAIRTAPEAFVALAAFVAQAVEGLQSAISVLGQKVDAILSNQAETNDAVLKAQADTLDLIKAIDDETPVTAFRSPAAFVNKEPLNKAHSDGPTHGYIIAQLEALIEQKRATPQDMAMFETGGHLRKDLKEAIEASWFADKDKFK